MKQGTALVVDDDPFVGMMLVAQLKAWGWSAQTVDDGARALALLQTQRFDTLLLDVMMPGLDGMATLAAIRQREQAGAPRQYVIMATAHEGDEVAAQLLAAGADGYVAKPVVAARLAAALAAIPEPTRQPGAAL